MHWGRLPREAVESPTHPTLLGPESCSTPAALRPDARCLGTVCAERALPLSYSSSETPTGLQREQTGSSSSQLCLSAISAMLMDPTASTTVSKAQASLSVWKPLQELHLLYQVIFFSLSKGLQTIWESKLPAAGRAKHYQHHRAPGSLASTMVSDWCGWEYWLFAQTVCIHGYCYGNQILHNTKIWLHLPALSRA